MSWPKGVSRKEWNEKMVGTKSFIEPGAPIDFNIANPAHPFVERTIDRELREMDYKEAFELLRWVAEKIKMRAANGRVGTQFCVICQKTNMRRQPCKHRRIWELTGALPT